VGRGLYDARIYLKNVQKFGDKYYLLSGKSKAQVKVIKDEHNSDGWWWNYVITRSGGTILARDSNNGKDWNSTYDINAGDTITVKLYRDPLFGAEYRVKYFTFKYYIDSSDPEISMSTINHEDNTVTVYFQATDSETTINNSSWLLSEDNVNWTTYTSPPSISFTEIGTHNVWVKVKNGVGKTTTTEFSIPIYSKIQFNNESRMLGETEIEGQSKALLSRFESLSIITNAFPDYVFSDGYNLLSIKELEEFINSNKHLPSIPPEKDITLSGINMLSLIQIQQEKIEELTLYIIELNIRKEELEKKIETISKDEQNEL
jgi:hypothetical protein